MNQMKKIIKTISKEEYKDIIAIVEKEMRPKSYRNLFFKSYKMALSKLRTNKRWVFIAMAEVYKKCKQKHYAHYILRLEDDKRIILERK